jgi:hypothetical protein
MNLLNAILVTLLLSCTADASVNLYKEQPLSRKTNQCPRTTMINTSGFPWNGHDRKTLKYTKKRCGEIYPDAPCVKWFKKWGKQDYSVICGAP